MPVQQMPTKSFSLRCGAALTVALLVLGGLSGCATNSTDARSRSLGTKIDDQVIEHKVDDDIQHANVRMREAHIDVTSFNGAVLLVGQIQDEELRQLAAQTAANVPNVRRVYNELTVGPDNGFAAHASDALITSKVKSQLWAQESIKDGSMVVLTEAGVVYLMGIVSREQADLAAQVAQNIAGVQKVVRLFEVIGEPGSN
ncbi:MAG: BON domain-containing protein [Spongiibacteraceae bacterium]